MKKTWGYGRLETTNGEFHWLAYGWGIVMMDGKEEFRSYVQCSNARHPEGPWHIAAPLTAGFWEGLRQWFNEKRWGCRCHRA